MTNNIFSQIGGTQIMRSGSGNNLTLSNNLFGKSESNLGTGAVIGNPQFLSTDPNNANFLRLATGSPACLSGGAYMGAFPCNGSTTPPTTPSPSPIATPNYNIADLEPDGDVDGNDYLTLVSKFGLTGILGWIRSDILKNGVVDIFDFNRLISNFGI
jgi:hypothetical protein